MTENMQARRANTMFALLPQKCGKDAAQQRATDDKAVRRSLCGVALDHIEYYCSEIKSTMNRYGDNIEIFLSDRDYQRSICLSLLQIGELVKRLSLEFRQNENQIPWKQICGLRDIVVHTYGELSFEDIFETIHQDIDNLYEFCKNN